MDKNLPQNSNFSPALLRIGLLFVLLATITEVFSSVSWIYHHIHQSLGLAIAEVVLAFLVIVIFGLIAVGFRTAIGARQDLRQHKCRARRVYRLFKRSHLFRAVWRHIGLPTEEERRPTNPQPVLVELPVILDDSPKRGRHATYSIDQWIPVVSAWENRDRWRNTLTLSEFLAEHFGTNADGSPLMSVNSFYDWKKRVHEELRRREATKKNISPD